MNKKYVIVFDLDETLGSFGQLSYFWKLTKDYLKNNELHKKYFFNIIDNFPLFFRPNLLKLLNFIKNKKIEKKCDYVIIYTNNNGPNEWANVIKDYLHYKLSYNLFDRIIRAFEAKGSRVEMCRTMNSKSYNDFISCTKLPENTQVCFLDDVYHKPMENKNVDYIKLEPYQYSTDLNLLAKTFYNKNKNLFNANTNTYLSFINKYANKYKTINKSKLEEFNDKEYTEELLKKVDNFLKSNKNKIIKTKKTRKKRKKRKEPIKGGHTRKHKLKLFNQLNT